jgi:hypothetical protein
MPHVYAADKMPSRIISAFASVLEFIWLGDDLVMKLDRLRDPDFKHKVQERH